MDEARISAHVCIALERSTLAGHPFDHVVVDDLLPPAVFAALVEALPETERYQRPEQPLAGRPAGERAILCRYDASMSGDLRTVVEPLDAALRSPAVVAVLVAKLRVAAHEPALTAGATRAQVILSRDIPPYEIGPHTDVPARVASGVLYLSPQGAPDAWGTTLFAPNDARFECSAGRHYGFNGFVPATTIPFRPNRAVIFRRTNRSFHGLHRIAANGHVRDVLLYEIVRSGAAISPRLPAEV